MPPVAETFVRELRASALFASFADGFERGFHELDIQADGSTEALDLLDRLLSIAGRRELLVEQRVTMMVKEFSQCRRLSNT